MNFYGIIGKIFFPLVKFYWFIFRPRSYGVKCVVYSGNEILMIRNTYGGSLWTFVGGGIKKGETVEEAARREVLEEVGVNLKSIRQIGQFESTKEYKRDNITVFAGEAVNKEFKIDPVEILEAKWFSIDNLPEMSELGKKILDMWKTISH